ncbi:hypothetical protein PG995_004027 [Apiospora arundinis]
MIFPRTLLTAIFALAPLISANPLPDTDDVTAFEAFEVEDAGAFALEDRAAKVYACPASNNGNHGNYPANSFTERQVTEAAGTAKAYQEKKGENWVPTPADYPHFFGNRERIPFNCGSKLAEFPIKMGGGAVTAGQPNVAGIPDRVIYEYKWNKAKKGKKLTVKVCGVIRHGPGADFINCPRR